jgi:hypothetical protein
VDSLALTHPEAAATWAHEKNKDAPELVRATLNRKVWWRCHLGHEWQDTIKQRAVLGRGCRRCAKLDIVRPDIAAQWHPTRNPGISPADFRDGSDKKVWWLCPKGHEWQATILRRTRRGGHCSACAGTVANGENNFAAKHPELAREWLAEKNSGKGPDRYKPGSTKMAWWKCGCGHTWQARINARTRGGGCPACSGRVATSENCLASTHPKLCEQWHSEKNGELAPSDFTAKNSAKVWWQCPESPEHTWQATINERAGKRKRGCPFCAGQRATSKTCLAIANPELAAQWVRPVRGEFTPADVLPGSSKRVVWKCSLGHEWEATVSKRSHGRGCAVCAGKQASPETCLRAVAPKIAAQWHPTKNGTRTPDNTMPGSAKKAWWLCSEGHEWNANIQSRVRANGCPVCAGKYAIPETSLAATNPELARQWHPTKNGELTADQVRPNKRAKVWWLCDAGHEWEAPVFIRNRGIGCRFCAGQEATRETSLAALNPEVTEQWHPTKNEDLSPWEVRPGSALHAWWTCPADDTHEWRARISHRTGVGSGCPHCKLLPRSEQEIALAFELKHFFDFDVDEHKIEIEGKRWDVDILLPKENLVIEFDGEFWHRDKLELDLAKSRSIREAGWRLIRVREQPLEVLHEDDVSVPTRRGKETADITLAKVAEVLGRRVRGLSTYLEKTEPQNSVAAEQYAHEHRKRRAARRKKRARREARRQLDRQAQIALPGM